MAETKFESNAGAEFVSPMLKKLDAPAGSP